MADQGTQPDARSGAEPGATAVLARRASRLACSARFAAILVFLVALAIRLAFVVGTPRESLAYDEVLYDGLARNVLDGRGYSLDGVETAVPEPYREGPTAIMAPGYPVFLMVSYSLFGRESLPVRLLQALIGAASCVLVYAVVRAWKLGPNSDSTVPYVALVAGLLAAASRVLVGWTNLVLSENLAVPLMLLAVLWLLRPPTRHRAVNIVSVSLALALAAHVRSELVIAVPVALLWVALVAPRLRDPRPSVLSWRARDAAWLAVVFALALVPWTVRNWQQLGGYVFVRSFSGPVMYYANNDDLRSVWAMAHGETAGMPSSAADLPVGDEIALDRFLRNEALAYMRAHPDRVLSAAALKSAEFWRPIAEPWRTPGSLMNRLLPGVLAWWLTFAGLFVGLRRPRRSALVYGTLAAELAFVALFAAWERERFRTPIYSFELMFLAAGTVWVTHAAWKLVTAVRDRRKPKIAPRTWLVAGGATLLAVVFAWWALGSEPVAAFSPVDRPSDLLTWQRLQGTEETVDIDVTEAARWPGSLRLTTRPEAGWQDIQLELPATSYRPNAIYRVTFDGRTDGRVGGQVYPLIPAPAEGERTVGLNRYVFHNTEWLEHSHFFFTPFDNRDRLAVYVSHADYEVPDAMVWIDDLAVWQSSWPRFLWEGYVRGSW
jgi:hypothetical protein